MTMGTKDMQAVYSKEDIERVKHRGRAYQCLACYYKKGERKVDELHRLEAHILKAHITQVRYLISAACVYLGACQSNR